MEWLIAVLTWNADTNTGQLLVQKDDDTLWPMTVDTINPETIGAKIAEQFNIPIQWIKYHETKQTMYRRLTYMRFMVIDDAPAPY